jgi:acyl dehydratase
MSKSVVVRYRTRPETADENAGLIEKVFAALAVVAPAGFQYATYRLADGVSFVHVASHADDHNPLSTLPEFAEFQRELPQRIADPPVPSDATIVGSYGLPRV